VTIQSGPRNHLSSLNPAGVSGISLLTLLSLSFLLPGRSTQAQSAGALGNGLSAASISRGGTLVAEHGDPLEAVEGNPAGLAGIRNRIVDVDALALFAQGSFRNSVDSDGHLRPFSGTLPYGAVGLPIKGRFSAAAAITPDFLMRATWHYSDPPGTADVSYGFQKNESEFVAVRGSMTLAFAPSPKWAFGAGLGLVYNTNTLHAPYIFQEQPELAGLKVLVDLHTRGFGWNGNAGVQWQPTDRLRFGAAWKSPTFIPSHGDVNGSASALFAALGVGANPTFHYGAEVDNHLPQTATAGLRWQQSRRVRLAFEGGWSDWGNAFENLPVKLKDGSNAVINSVAGSAAIRDEIPLHWKDQGTFRGGIEVPVKQWTARAGYSFLSNPVPSSTITPLTAAILSNGLSTGLGWQPESSGNHPPLVPSSWSWDVAYQLQLPASQSVGQSSLKAGEYSDTSIHVMTQSVTVSARLNF
jgi:long-subunit fatty acid transport protein